MLRQGQLEVSRPTLILSTDADCVLRSDDISKTVEMLEKEKEEEEGNHPPHPHHHDLRSGLTKEELEERRRARRARVIATTSERARARARKEGIYHTTAPPEVTLAQELEQEYEDVDSAWLQVASANLRPALRPLLSHLPSSSSVYPYGVGVSPASRLSPLLVERKIGTSEMEPSAHDLLAAPSQQRVQEALHHMLVFMEGQARAREMTYWE